MNEGTVVAEFSKNSRETLRVSLTTYNGIELCDVRAFYEAGGEMKPGKGLAIRRELITPLRKALQAAEKAIKDGGKASGQDEKGGGQDEADA